MKEGSVLLAAVALATLAVTLLILGLGVVPKIALFLAVSFGLYGLCRKRLQVDPLTALFTAVCFASLIGALAGALVVYAIVAFDRLKIDDPVGAISVHGVCGLFGLMVVPFSNTSATFGAQLLGAATIFGWVFVVSLVVWSLLKATMGLRVSEEEEMMGVDVHECGIDAYPEFVSVKSSI